VQRDIFFFCCEEDMPGVAYEGRTMEINYFEIGKSIRDHRIRQGFTQEQLSEYADISPGYLSKIENGFSKPSLETLLALSFSLGVSINEIVYSESNLEKHNMPSAMIDDLLKECTPRERELIYLVIKEFIAFLTKYGIRM
jgi:transcriptional regulator with XRE-family HTH domain